MAKSSIISKRTLTSELYALTVGELREFIDAFPRTDDNNKITINVSQADRPGETSQITISGDVSFESKPLTHFRGLETPGRIISHNGTSPKDTDYVGPYGNGVAFGE